KGYGKPFALRYWGKQYLVLPPKYLADIKRADKDHLSFFDSISDVFFMYNWIGDLFKSSRMVSVVTKGINPILPKLTKPMIEESFFAFDIALGAFVALEFFSAIILRTVARILAGKELCRDPAFLDATTSYIAGNFMLGTLMLHLPFKACIRDFLAWPLCKYHAKTRQQRLLDIIKPIVTKRMQEERLGTLDTTEFDGISVTLKLLKDFPLDKNVSQTHTIAHEIRQLMWAAGQSPAITLTSMLFRLLSEPAYIEPLRKEAQAAVAKHGWNDEILRELPLQDSYIREVHRMQPLFTLNAPRKVMDKPFTFSDGLTLSIGTQFAFPAEASQQDPDNLEKGQDFDGYRFAKLGANAANQEEESNKWAASHADATNMVFGYGNHVCPGRWMAVRLIKIVFSKVLIDYDVSWDRAGEEPPRFVLEGISVPNPTQKVYFQRRVNS
ncbi:cytochrome P450, partial [Glonium stellatum]